MSPKFLQPMLMVHYNVFDEVTELVFFVDDVVIDLL